MKNNRISIGLVVVLISMLSACMKNDEIIHPDFDFQTIYFGTQFPIRTVELGEDLFIDNTLDNQRKVLVNVTTGGVRENKKDIVTSFVVDTSLCSRLFFPADKGGNKILPLPANYYQLASNQITIPKGSFLGGVEVQLTDAFFEDPLTIGNNYALPLVLSDVKGADSVLRGIPSVATPNRSIDANWTIKPRDFVLYSLKYVNVWHGNYLRRGTDVITGSVNQTLVRRKQFVENDEVNKLSTVSLSKLNFPVVFKNASGNNVGCTLQLTFDASNNCTITSITNGVTASGTGKFVKKGEVNSWGSKDRDALYLDYLINLTAQNMRVASKDTLVVRDRALSIETFVPVYK
ncbi:DUF1735 domain-containing protein [Segetibacter sp. 3557_3]|uniref:DUF5627 domain-containing protein n=1 Tax=Segetibacter sp. 3557_3 TaxID=2547429 RepID=UPI001058A194|nr:DUF5627 domain-containing protein [Segetibacter sp. 3557_3]TDH23505.1 DUF1735 domain-containing protein [Segetibacter sp. 3557_3]